MMVSGILPVSSWETAFFAVSHLDNATSGRQGGKALKLCKQTACGRLALCIMYFWGIFFLFSSLIQP
jgi:hypothetical protein